MRPLRACAAILLLSSFGYGKPVLEGACGNAQVAVPVASEFAAYVLVKD